MPPKPSLFSWLHPLIKSDPVFIQSPVKAEDHHLSIRPVWLIGDLELLYQWTGSPLKKTNWIPDQSRSTLYRYYKEILLSENGQCFMFEENQKALLQFDIVPCNQWEFPVIVSRTEHDYFLRFLYQENFRDPHLLSRSLQCVVRCLSAYAEVESLYLPLLRPDSVLSGEVRKAGFEQQQLYNHTGRYEELYIIAPARKTG